MSALFGALGSMPGGQATTPKKAGKAKQAQETAEYFVTIADYMVMGMQQDQRASMQQHERHLMVNGLADMLQNSDSVAKVAGILNPIALVAGVGLWSARNVMLWLEKHPDITLPWQNKPKAKPQAAPARQVVADPAASSPAPGYQAVYNNPPADVADPGDRRGINLADPAPDPFTAAMMADPLAAM